jgi:glycine/D-amino acid oxidase-like deaminating enzyme
MAPGFAAVGPSMVTVARCASRFGYAPGMPPSPAHPLARTEARPLWQAQAGALPDWRGRALPEGADVVVVGGGYTGVSAARQLARQGARVTLLEAERLGFGASTRNGGLAHPGYKWGPTELIRRYGEETGRGIYRETLDGYGYLKQLIVDEAIDAEFSERGHLELAYAPAHVERLHAAKASLDAVGVESAWVPRERLREEIGSDGYFGALAIEGSATLHPAKYFAGLATAAARAGADLHEGVRARAVRPRRDGRVVVETDRGAIIARDVIVGTNGYTDGFVPALRRRVIPIGSYIIATEPLPEDLARELSPKGRAFFDTKNFLYYWRLSSDRRMVFGGRASFIPTSVDKTAAILRRGMVEVHPQLRDTPIDYAWGGNVGFTVDRMPHVGRLGGVTYAMGYCGTGVVMATYLGAKVAEWLGGGPAPALARLRFPLVPAPYEGRPWFLPFAGEWFRLQDRLAARTRG